MKKMLETIQTTAIKTGLKVKKHSPEILIAVGVVGVITSTVMACKATTKISSILEETNETIELINNSVGDTTLSEEYTEDDRKKDLTIVYVQSGVKFIKLYAPAVAVGVLSLICIVSSHNILHKRNIALATAYAGIDKAYKEYRNRVIDRYGKDIEDEIYKGIKKQKVETTIIDEKTGKEKKVKEEVTTVSDMTTSPYARFFEAGNPNWEKDGTYNFNFLAGAQSHFNRILQKNGVVFLNDVYKHLGLPISPEGQLVGWIFDDKKDINNQNGDGHIDFGIFDVSREAVRNFQQGFEPTILLDFNVDGEILSKI